MPTVATQNGGPVDIMKTLHHGVTVDPTSSQQLGNELLKILTNHSAWECMSRNGACRPAAPPALQDAMSHPLRPESRR